MESLFHKIRSIYPEMGPSEKKIANFVLENTGEVVNLSISELAEKSGSGDATVVRFARRLGFDGYQGMKIGIAKELNSVSSIDAAISKNDSCHEIFSKRISDISVSLNNTESVLDDDSLDTAAKTIMNAKRIVIFGLGNSAAIAMDAAHKFLRLGLDAQACCDNHMQAIIASHLDKNSVAIGISHSGASRDIIEALELAKNNKATTISITNHGVSPIMEVSDIVLNTKSDETRRSILAMSSRIAQLAILDAIYTYIVINTDKNSVQAIYNTETALLNKKNNHSARRI